MQIIGIVAEYNPFHTGHAYQIQMAKKISGADHVLAVMSGNFVQRGEPALIDKWVRARMAVLSGVDLVLELPVVFALRSAQFFAAGAVRLLSLVGATHLVFGCEAPQMTVLQIAAQALCNPALVPLLKEQLNAGCSYAKAQAAALSQLTGLPPCLLRQPNNLLAIEYLRTLIDWQLSLQPLAITRQGAGHNQSEMRDSYASSTALRQHIYDKSANSPGLQSFLLPAALSELRRQINNGHGPADTSVFDAPILAALRRAAPEELSVLPAMGEGLEHALKKAARRSCTSKQLVQQLAGKRYTLARIQRLLLHYLLGLTGAQCARFDQSGPLYARVLAFNDKGRTILRRLQSQNLPVISKFADFLPSNRPAQLFTPAQAMLAFDQAATDLYSLSYPDPSLRIGGWDSLHSPDHLLCPAH